MVDMFHDADKLTQLIEQALVLADDNELALVSIKLDEALNELITYRIESGSLSSMDSLISDFPTAVALQNRSGDNVVSLRSPASLERLMSDHIDLDIRRKSLIQLVRGPQNVIEAQRQLTEFGKLIDAHRALERCCIYGPLMTRGIDAGFSLEERLRTLLGEIETDWDSYLYTWDCDRLETQWAEFTVATHTILARAGERMRLEEKVIYPLCFMSGLINMKDAVS
jgi:hypothetical protein